MIYISKFVLKYIVNNVLFYDIKNKLVLDLITECKENKNKEILCLKNI